MATTDTFTFGSSQHPFELSFPFINEDNLVVTLDGVEQQLGTDYTVINKTSNTAAGVGFLSGARIQFTASPLPTTGAVKVVRNTTLETTSTFKTGSAIRAIDLNSNFTQNLYVTEEISNNAILTDGSNAFDSNLNMGGNQITNLGTPATDSDAVTKLYVDSRVGSSSIPGYTRWRTTATASQTIFSGVGESGGTLAYSATRENVYVNGALQQRTVDYTADNGTTITFIVGLQAGDIVDVVCVNNVSTVTSDQSSEVYFLQSGTGATTRTVENKLKDVVSVKDFGAKGDNVTNDAPAIQAALDWLETTFLPIESAYNRGAVALYFPAGSYRCESPLTLGRRNNLTIYGDSGATVIYSAVHTDATLTIGDTDLQTNNLTIRDITFAGRSVGTTTTDVALKLIRTYGCTLDNVKCVEAHTGLIAQGMINGFIRGCQFRRNTNTVSESGINILLEVSQTTGGAYNGISSVHIQDCEFMGRDDPSNRIEACIKVKHCDGLYIDNCHMYQAKYDLWFDPDGVGNNGIVSVFTSNTYFDTTNTNSVRIGGTVLNSGTSDVTAKVYKELFFSNCFFRDTSICVLNAVNSGTDYYPQNVVFDGCIFKSATNGINTPSSAAAMDFSCDGCTFERISSAAIFSDAVSKASITNCIFSDQNNLTTPGAAISLTPTTTSNLYIADNQFTETYSNASPLTIANYKGSVSIEDQASNFNNISVLKRTFTKSCPGSAVTTFIGPILLVDKMSGVCEYTIYGTDDSDSNSGYHFKTGTFGFRNNAGVVSIDADTIGVTQTFGTLGTNTITTSTATNQFRLAVLNNDTNAATYIVKYRIILGSVGAV